MRLWDVRLVKFLPQKQLVSQWRECIAIKRQWEKGTLKHRLVSYVMDYHKEYFYWFVYQVAEEMRNRKIKYQSKYYDEIQLFCESDEYCGECPNYPQHNDRYLKQCLYNLQEKADRGIISKEEWEKIYEKFKDFIEY